MGRSLSITAVVAALLFANTARAEENILVIVTDDQRAGTLNVMPTTRAAFPVRFSNYFVTTDLCCPSRATYLTGQYAHNHGVRTNQSYSAFAARDIDSLGPWLRSQGYFTGFVGKYFNHFNAADGVPPGWDEFHSILWGPNGAKVSDNCTTLTMRRKDAFGDEVVVYDRIHCTDLFAEIAVNFLDHATDPAHNPSGKPFALFVWPNAPNFGVPPERHARAGLPPWQEPPSFLEADLSDKPSEVRRSRWRRDSAEIHEATRARQLRSLMAVDDLVERLVLKLEDVGAADSTWGMFTSDNGRFWGEHRLSGKLYGYEEGVHLPLRMRVPGLEDGRIDALVANIDVAPTLLDLAGDPTGHAFDGSSFLPLLNGDALDWRRAFLAEGWGYARYDSIRTMRWRYVFWPTTGHEELYDLDRDRFELTNIAVSRREVVERLHARLRRLKRS